jgi:hypothetical protein
VPESKNKKKKLCQVDHLDSWLVWHAEAENDPPTFSLQNPKKIERERGKSQGGGRGTTKK